MINQFLATFFAKFKTNNPKEFAIFVILITGFYVLLSSGEFTAILGTPTWVASVLSVVTVIYAALKGVHTTETLKGK